MSTPYVNITVIEFSRHDIESPKVIVSWDADDMRRDTLAYLVGLWQVAPGLFYDDAPAFMAEHGILSKWQIKAMKNKEVATWLIQFNEATTSPYATTYNERVR